VRLVQHCEKTFFEFSVRVILVWRGPGQLYEARDCRRQVRRRDRGIPLGPVEEFHANSGKVGATSDVIVSLVVFLVGQVAIVFVIIFLVLVLVVIIITFLILFGLVPIVPIVALDAAICWLACCHGVIGSGFVGRLTTPERVVVIE
jgi:hypothetical protein